VGEITVRSDDIAAITSHLRETGLDEAVCNLAAWANRGPYGQYLAVQLSPPYVQHDQQPANNLDFVFGDQEDA
jgi:hypothetical protein